MENAASLEPTSAPHLRAVSAEVGRLLTVALIAPSVLVWVAIMSTGGGASSIVSAFGLNPLGRCFLADDTTRWYQGAGQAACLASGNHWVPGVATGAPWQVVTSVFTHVSPQHLVFNMVALWFLGPGLGRVLGTARYLALFAVSGLVGSATVTWLSPLQTTTIGASGAVFGLMAATLVVALRRGGDVKQILVWIGINVVVTVSEPGISWQGHLGGFLGGLVVAGLLAVGPDAERERWSWWAVLAVAVLAVAAVWARAAILLSAG